jgi:CheY-like chemotaxis protein
LLREKVPAGGAQKLLDTWEANVQRGSRLIKQMLAFGRGVKGERVPVRLNTVLREIKQLIAETFPKSVELSIHAATRDLWPVIGDATQLHQVLLNLCVNARDAMPDGGKLSISVENVVLDETDAGLNLDARPGSYLLIKVADTGTGIPREIQDRIFEPFFTTKGPNKGTGLGLSACLGIVKSHGGFMVFCSEPGRGSVFKVYFPADLTAAVNAENPAEPQSDLPRGRHQLVLVVDDEKAIRDAAQATLEHFGYHVLTATNGAEAVSIYQQHPDKIDVVLTDMAMPVMDGRTAIATLKTINPQVKIISMSGFDTESGSPAANDGGRRHFIAKPYTTARLLQTLQSVLAP